MSSALIINFRFIVLYSVTVNDGEAFISLTSGFHHRARAPNYNDMGEINVASHCMIRCSSHVRSILFFVVL